MAVHIFVVNRENFNICIHKGLAAIPSAKADSRIKDNTNNQLISRMTSVRKDDLILFYIIKEKLIYGVYKAIECSFYDKTPIWQSLDSQLYPFRIRIDNSKYVFNNPIELSDIYDLRDNGKIWTFNLRSNRGTNSMFSISEVEYQYIFELFLKTNKIIKQPNHIKEPYRHIEPNISDYLTLNSKKQPKYEATLTAFLIKQLAKNQYHNIFGNYSDYLAYVPTSFEKEIDVVLFHSDPRNLSNVIAYSIIELKRDKLDETGLSQLLMYEDWFLKKRVNGDSRSIRTFAIASSFTDGVINYLKKREELENKKVSLLTYILVENELKISPYN
ncbi:MAG: EVE domain-containing protein [Cyanobacteria bacterium P01_A01_bin.83]